METAQFLVWTWIFIIACFWCLVPAGVAARTAEEKNREWLSWFIAGLCFSWIAVVVAFVATPKEKKS